MSTQEQSGIWMRGAEGALYFIPDGELAAFRVPGEQAAAALKEIDADDAAPGHARAIPQITPLLAVRGPLAKRDLGAGPAAIVPPAAQLRGLRQTR